MVLGMLRATSGALRTCQLVAEPPQLSAPDIIGSHFGATWMILTGLGSYLVYVPFGSVLFDRLIATTGVAATAVFTIYVADALGYTGSVGVQLYRDLAESDATRLVFFRRFTYLMSVGALALLAFSLAYFLAKTRAPSEPAAT